MTVTTMTADEIRAQTLVIVDRFIASTILETAGLFVTKSTDYNTDNILYFGPDERTNSWDSYCHVKVHFDYCERESSDVVGYYTEKKLLIGLHSNGINYRNLDECKGKIIALNKAVELMGLFVAELPRAIIERGETHAERADALAVRAARNYCLQIARNNSKFLRVEAAKVLPPNTSALREGEYVVNHANKTFKVILTADSTTLVRVD